MAKKAPYHIIIAESFRPSDTSGRHGPVHIRPAPGQIFPQDLFVECSKEMVTNYPVGTKFRIRVKLTDREGSTPFLYSSYKWPFDVL